MPIVIWANMRNKVAITITKPLCPILSEIIPKKGAIKAIIIVGMAWIHSVILKNSYNDLPSLDHVKVKSLSEQRIKVRIEGLKSWVLAYDENTKKPEYPSKLLET